MNHMLLIYVCGRNIHQMSNLVIVFSGLINERKIKFQLSGDTNSKMYTLTVYYRSTTAVQDEAGAVSKGFSPGHPYVSLRGDGDKEEFFGLYKPDSWVPIGTGEIVSEKEKMMHKHVMMLSKSHDKDYVFAKQIQLTKEQYDKTIAYARSTIAKDNLYVLGLCDCVEFVQSVYNAAGLPLHFTQIYSSEELSQLPNLASYKIKLKYDIVKPGLINVKGFTRDQVASELNIPADRLEPIVNVGLDDLVDIQQSFQINLKESDFLPKSLIKTITSQEMFHAINQNDHLSSTSQDPLQDGSNNYNITTLVEQLLLLGLGQSNTSSRNPEKLSRMIQKVKELILKVRSAMNDTIKDFIDNKNKLSVNEQNHSIENMNSEIQNIAASIESYNQTIFAQKQAELTAETEARVAQAKAAAQNMRSTIPQTITITNADIAARKQSEYDSMVEIYKQSCESKIQSLRGRSQEQREARHKAVENEVTNKIEKIKIEGTKLAQDLSSTLQEVAAKLNQGDGIDVDAVITDLDAKASFVLESFKQIAK